MSTASSQATFVPILPGHDAARIAQAVGHAPAATAHGCKYRRTTGPSVTGEPPVTSDASPGNESDGVDVELLVYVTPWRLSAASVESLWLAT